MDFYIPQRTQLQIHKWKDTLFSFIDKGGGTIGYPCGRNFSQITTLLYTNQFQIRNLDVKSKIKKPFEDNIGECLCDLRVEKNLWNKPWTVLTVKERLIHSSSLKCNFVYQKIHKDNDKIGHQLEKDLQIGKKISNIVYTMLNIQNT